MFFKQFFDQSLAQSSYLIGCQATGEAVVVDALRDVAPYVEVAQREGLRITHITETHIHADFVSGSRELAARTNGALFLSAEGGADWQYAFAASDGATLLRDGDVIRVGNITLEAMHTPGHTPEHLSFVVSDLPAHAGPMGILSGDCVFVGDVGRPDLLEKAAGVADTMEAAARTLFVSLARFRELPDHLQLWPGHGAGSACGKALGAVPASTVGYEKRANWGLTTTNESDFARGVLDGQPDPPLYFAQMKRINRDGPTVLGPSRTVPQASAAQLTPTLMASSHVVDIRTAASYATGHVPDTLSVPLNKSFATWCGWLLPYDSDIWLITDERAAKGEVPGSIEHAIRELSLIGLDRIAGWFDGEALTEWSAQRGPMQGVPQITAQAVSALRTSATASGTVPPLVLDVRTESEWNSGHLEGAQNMPLGRLQGALGHLSKETPLIVHCLSGARSAIASSVLLRAGFTSIHNLDGGIAAWKAAALPVTQTQAKPVDGVEHVDAS